MIKKDVWYTLNKITLSLFEGGDMEEMKEIQTEQRAHVNRILKNINYLNWKYIF